MAVCVSYNSTTGGVLATGQNPQECNQMILISSTDYLLLNEGRQFNKEVFSTVVGLLLVAFLTGHGAGRVVRWLGK